MNGINVGRVTVIVKDTSHLPIAVDLMKAYVSEHVGRKGGNDTNIQRELYKKFDRKSIV
jgi:hypothetical protein